MSELSDQLDHFREQMLDREGEIQQMAEQIAVAEKLGAHTCAELQATVARLESDNLALKVST